MVEKLSQFTDVTAALIVGGLSLQVQAATLRKQPEVRGGAQGGIDDSMTRQPAALPKAMQVGDGDKGTGVEGGGCASERRGCIVYWGKAAEPSSCNSS